MSGSPFRFKQFIIQQERSSLKVGTDAVLLGSWVDPSDCKTILDIGTGTGVIAIMLAQKSSAEIAGIDIHKESCEEAALNAERSPWKDRIKIIHTSLQDLSFSSDMQFDLIVSNPPYFEENVFEIKDPKTIAKHTSTLSYLELISGVKNLLKPEGRFCLILPFQEGKEFRILAKTAGLSCARKVRILTLAGKPEKRLMMEFRFGEFEWTESELIVQDEDHRYTKEYIEFTKEYYLGLK